jgi:transposase
MEKHEQSIVSVPSRNGKRRRFSGLFKREVVEQTLRADVSIASVALANGLNTNLLARWRHDYLKAQAAGQSPALIPIRIVESQPALSSARAQLAAAVDDGEIEVRRGDTTVIIRGVPNQAALGMVLCELLQSGLGASK